MDGFCYFQVSQTVGVRSNRCSGSMTAENKSSLFHYGWVIVTAGTATLFACLGLGRFALGMLLPSMGRELGLNYSQMGMVSTSNFIGYMVSVVLAGAVARWLGARLTIFSGLILTGCSMAVISQADRFIPIALLYFLTGIGSGLANVPMMGLISHWFLKNTRGRAAGFMLSGNGLAIVFAGFYVPWINSAQGTAGWRTGWLTMGLICLAIAAVAVMLLKNDPKEKGLSPFGRAGTEARSPEQKSSGRVIVHLGAVYALFGATYVVYATFIVTAMVNERGFSEASAGLFWAVVGGLSILSGPFFGALSDRMGRKRALMLVFFLFTSAYVLAAARLPDICLYISILIFGLTVWSVPPIMSAAVGDYLGPEKAVRAFGFITVFFGGGQILGPLAAGFLADLSRTFGTAFWLSAALTCAAIVLSAFLPEQPDKTIQEK